MKKSAFEKSKAAEANTRVVAVQRARRSSRVARALQKRASLVGGGAKWRITNFEEVARAMARWA